MYGINVIEASISDGKKHLLKMRRAPVEDSTKGKMLSSNISTQLSA